MSPRIARACLCRIGQRFKRRLPHPANVATYRQGWEIQQFNGTEPDAHRSEGVDFQRVQMLAALSFGAASGAIGARAARVSRIIGPEYLSLVSFVDFNQDPFGGDPARIAYCAPFLALTIAGPLLCLGALGKRQLYPFPMAAS